MYRGREGQWAFVLHRLSGVALALYLLLHVIDISLVMYGPDGPFDLFLAFYHQWPFRIGLVLVMAGVVYHALNGLRIILMGGDERRMAELSARAAPGGAAMEFTGRLPHAQVMSRLASACIAVLPNRDETDSAFTSPIKLFEYMAAGCAIVASDLPALREILREDDAEWVKPGNPDSLAAGIRRLASDTQRAQALGDRVRARSLDYTWIARGRKLKVILESLHAGAPGRGNAP